MSEQNLFTIGQIADRLMEPPARIAYIISKHRLKPVSRIGIIRLFGEEHVKAIRQGLYGLQVRRSL